MPTPSWMPWGNDRSWGLVGCGGVLWGVGGKGGVVGALLAVGTSTHFAGWRYGRSDGLWRLGVLYGPPGVAVAGPLA